MAKAAKARTGITDPWPVLKHIHLSEVYNAGGVAKAAPLAFSLHSFNRLFSRCPSARELTGAVMSQARFNDLKRSGPTIEQSQVVDVERLCGQRALTRRI